MAKRFPIHPAHPERLCWGCDQYCAADDMRCGNGSDRTQHPVELFGEDWSGWEDEETESAPRPSLLTRDGGVAPVDAGSASGQEETGLQAGWLG